jgi:predicted dehydrogenase
MTTSLKAGVAGAGVFGGFHARKYAGLPGVELAAVYDVNPERAQTLAAELGARAFTDLSAFLEAAADVVTIASPAVAHAAEVRQALEAGRHVYVEKPIADDIDEAHALVRLAQDRKLVLAAGHQEREVFQAMGLLGLPERPLRMEAVRKGVRSDRNLDVSVVLDLMIHDLDLALVLADTDVDHVEAEGCAPVGPGLDECEAEVVFEGGMTAVFKASRVAEARERTMRAVFPSGELWLDFLTHEFSNTTPFKLDPAWAATAKGKDPLGASVADFLAAVRGEIPRPLVTGAEAARALDLALRVEIAAAATSE